MCSYHFMADGSSYISYEAGRLFKTGDGKPNPDKKYHTDASFDCKSRTFTGKTDWSAQGGALGDQVWDFVMIFSDDFSRITGGTIKCYGPNGEESSKTEIFNEEPYIFF